MSFKDRAREILKHQEPDRVDQFIQSVNTNYAGAQDESGHVRHKIYRPKHEPVISNSETALKKLKSIIDDPMYSDARMDLSGAINAIDKALDWNNQHKPTGKYSLLTLADKYLLLHLKQEFKRRFPDLKAQYVRGSTLRKLGEALLDKKLSDSTDKLIDSKHL